MEVLRIRCLAFMFICTVGWAGKPNNRRILGNINIASFGIIAKCGIIRYNFIMKKDYVIWTPSYRKSNGVKALHRLYGELEKRGLNVYLYSGKPYTDGYRYVEKISEDLRNNAVVIYPEIVFGNPLRFQNVVRYVLNYPGLLGGEKTYHNSEVIFAHVYNFYSSANILTIPWIDETLFYKDNSPKTQDCYFVYKGGKFRNAKETEGLLEINMNFPKTQKELADLLRTTKVLYSYDSCSSILDEAILCGVEVKIITKDGIENYNVSYYELIKDFEKNMENFINITQNMYYTGRIEPIKWRNLFKRILRILKFFIFKSNSVGQVYPTYFSNLQNIIRGF